MQDGSKQFYESYATYKAYETPAMSRKTMRRYDDMVWGPGSCQASMRFLELGCGTGAFLSYLAAKGCAHFVGVDHDPALASVLPQNVADHFVCGDIWEFLADPRVGTFDRIVAMDVFEHFSAEDALRLLQVLKGILNPGGKLILKVPNAACPWGLQYQFGDLTHRTAFTPHSIRQLADAAQMDAARVFAVRQGSRRRMVTDALLHRFLSWALLTPPEIWTANFVAVLDLRQG